MGVGEGLRRREDHRLVAGAGRYADDLRLASPAFAAFARSPHAHAAIRAIRTEAAREAPGVLAVLTAADLEVAGLTPIPHSIGSSKIGADVAMANLDGSERARTPHRALPADRVRFVGDAFAAVVAETAAQARDAAELIDVDWDVLPANVDPLAPDAPLLWDGVAGNLALEAHIGDRQATDLAFSAAAHVARFRGAAQRVTGVHMEPRTSAAEYDAATETFTLHASSGVGVVMMRDQMAAVFGIAPEKMRVVAPPDVGGNFGTRNAIYPEFVVLALAAKRVGRPVKHVADRTEAFLSDYQGRDLHIDAELALDADGKFLALRSVNTANIGAHTVSYVPLNKGAQLMTSLYAVPVASVTARAVLTNTPPTIPYRSAGRPEAMYAIERLIDIAARRFGFDRIELRRRNMLASGEAHRNPFGITYDAGDYAATMRQALELADWDGFEDRRVEARGRGKLRGLGFSNYIEGTSGIPRERAEIVVDGARRTVDVIVGTQDTGQGHATAFAQLVGSLLGVAHETVTIRTGDTDFVKAGGGTHSGRSLRFSSIVFQQAAQEIVSHARRRLAESLSRPVDDVSYADGHFRVVGTNESATLFELAARAPEKRFEAVADVVTPGLAFPYGAATCEIEVDPETGSWEIVRYVSVDDVGRALNPMIVHGQTHGGIVQGAGQALMEAVMFDAENGQALSASMMDYAMPRAADFPSFVSAISEVPSPNHPLGFRPGGEGGTTPALGLVTNALVDAVAHLGIEDIAMPATPHRIWQAIQEAKTRSPQ